MRALIVDQPNVEDKEDLIRDIYKSRIQYYSTLMQIMGAGSITAFVSLGVGFATRSAITHLARDLIAVAAGTFALGILTLLGSVVCAWKAHQSFAGLMKAMRLYQD